MKKIFISTLCILMGVFLANFCFAQQAQQAEPPKATMKSVLKTLGDSAGYVTEGVNETSISGTVGIIIRAFLSMLGIIFLFLIIVAGYNWMTASGDQEKVAKAKDTITRAIIGLIITIGAYAIWMFIYLKFIIEAVE